MTLPLCMFSRYLPIFITAKLPEHFMGQLHKALMWVQGKGWEQTAWGRKGRKGLQQLILIYSVSGQPQKTN